MFNYLVDHLNRLIGKPTYWRRMVDAFLLKYPDVEIGTFLLMYPSPRRGGSPRRRDPEFYPPEAFLVWRIGTNGNDVEGRTIGDFTPLRDGTYVVQFFVSSHAAQTELSRQMFGPGKVKFGTKIENFDGRTAVTAIANFHYNAPVGELSATTSFLEMVLEQDVSRIYRSSPRRMR
jgi:hypothetical protein